MIMIIIVCVYVWCWGTKRFSSLMNTLWREIFCNTLCLIAGVMAPLRALSLVLVYHGYELVHSLKVHVAFADGQGMFSTLISVENSNWKINTCVVCKVCSSNTVAGRCVWGSCFVSIDEFKSLAHRDSGLCYFSLIFNWEFSHPERTSLAKSESVAFNQETSPSERGNDILPGIHQCPTLSS